MDYIDNDDIEKGIIMEKQSFTISHNSRRPLLFPVRRRYRNIPRIKIITLSLHPNIRLLRDIRNMKRGVNVAATMNVGNSLSSAPNPSNSSATGDPKAVPRQPPPSFSAPPPLTVEAPPLSQEQVEPPPSIMAPSNKDPGALLSGGGIRTPPRSIIPTAFHAAYFSFNSLLIELIQVKFQNPSETPFESHPIIAQMSVLALCVYGILVTAKMAIETKFKYHSSILNAVILFSALVTPISLALLFLPN